MREAAVTFSGVNKWFGAYHVLRWRLGRGSSHEERLFHTFHSPGQGNEKTEAGGADCRPHHRRSDSKDPNFKFQIGFFTR